MLPLILSTLAPSRTNLSLFSDTTITPTSLSVNIHSNFPALQLFDIKDNLAFLFSNPRYHPFPAIPKKSSPSHAKIIKSCDSLWIPTPRSKSFHSLFPRSIIHTSPVTVLLTPPSLLLKVKSEYQNISIPIF